MHDVTLRDDVLSISSFALLFYSQLYLISSFDICMFGLQNWTFRRIPELGINKEWSTFFFSDLVDILDFLFGGFFPSRPLLLSIFFFFFSAWIARHNPWFCSVVDRKTRTQAGEERENHDIGWGLWVIIGILHRAQQGTGTGQWALDTRKRDTGHGEQDMDCRL